MKKLYNRSPRKEHPPCDRYRYIFSHQIESLFSLMDQLFAKTSATTLLYQPDTCAVITRCIRRLVKQLYPTKRNAGPSITDGTSDRVQRQHCTTRRRASYKQSTDDGETPLHIALQLHGLFGTGLPVIEKLLGYCQVSC